MVFGVIAALYAVYLFLVLAEGFSEYAVNHAVNAPQNWQFFYYFTTQSNLLVWLWLIVFAVASLGDGALAAKARRLVTTQVVLGLAIYMIVVFVVVVAILSPFYSGQFEPVPTGGALYEHVISPMLIVAIFLLYPLGGRPTWRTVLAWEGYLIFYVVLANIVGAVTTFTNTGMAAYPYNFINPHSYPNVGVYLLVIVGLAVLCFLIGVGLIRLKQRFDAGWQR